MLGRPGELPYRAVMNERGMLDMVPVGAVTDDLRMRNTAPRAARAIPHQPTLPNAPAAQRASAGGVRVIKTAHDPEDGPRAFLRPPLIGTQPIYVFAGRGTAVPKQSILSGAETVARQTAALIAAALIALMPVSVATAGIRLSGQTPDWSPTVTFPSLSDLFKWDFHVK